MRIVLLALLLGFGAGALVAAPAGKKTMPKRLIEFGWDEPDTAFMRQHIAEMERAVRRLCLPRQAAGRVRRRAAPGGDWRWSDRSQRP